MGDKITARTAMASLGVPLVPGSDGALPDLDSARLVADTVGYPVLIKATAGGGGRGMKVAQSEDELEEAWRVARTEARAAFGNDEVYLEKYLDRPRHIELQIMADSHGNVVHFGERDCSLQRRHQKLLEEAGSPALTATERDAIGATATAALARLGYRNAGTLEFLYQDGQFAFIEMNTRLQVEHPVTEMVCNVDLVREQIRIAAGEELGYGQADVRFEGHAIECRVNAEDPETFLPTPGKVAAFRLRRPALLRQPRRQTHRPRPHPPRSHRPPPPRTRRIRHPRHQDNPAAPPAHHRRTRVPGRRLHHPLARTIRRTDPFRQIAKTKSSLLLSFKKEGLSSTPAAACRTGSSARSRHKHSPRPRVG
jgi:acetyl/propionyl-CoA carboxylase alpha subunit